MNEGERRGVQRVAVETGGRPRARFSVDRIADDRMAQGREVNSDLVGPPRLQRDLEQGEFSESLEHPIAGDRPPAAPGGHDGHPDPVSRLSADGRVYDVRVRLDAPMNQREIAPVNR